MEKKKEDFLIIEEVYRFKNIMNENGLILMYSDNITSGTLESLVTISEDKLSRHTSETKTKRKVFQVMVECLQNISRHGMKDEATGLSSIFIIGKDESKRFFILSGNTIAKKDMADFKKKLDHVNSLSPEQLHESYLEIINDGKMSDKGGAGLGLIEMARKSKNKMEYHFRPLDDNSVFFTFKINIEG
jgi:hypothetical protein